MMLKQRHKSSGSEKDVGERYAWMARPLDSITSSSSDSDLGILASWNAPFKAFDPSHQQFKDVHLVVMMPE